MCVVRAVLDRNTCVVLLVCLAQVNLAHEANMIVAALLLFYTWLYVWVLSHQSVVVGTNGLLHGLPAELLLPHLTSKHFQCCTKQGWHFWLIWVVSTCRTITELLQRFGYKKDAKFPHKYGGYFRNDADHRDFVGIGTAAGQSCLLVLLPLGRVAFCHAFSSPSSC